MTIEFPPQLNLKLSDHDLANKSSSFYIVFELTLDSNLFKQKLLQLERILTVKLLEQQKKRQDDELSILNIVAFAGIGKMYFIHNNQKAQLKTLMRKSRVTCEPLFMTRLTNRAEVFLLSENFVPMAVFYTCINKQKVRKRIISLFV